MSDLITYTEDNQRNLRTYHHAGCMKWTVPMDDSVAPGAAECPECIRFLTVENEAGS